MSTSRRNGFVPCRSLTGGQTFRTGMYQTSTNLVRTLGIGDPIVAVSGYVQRWTTANASSFVGVVRAVYNSNKRPTTFNQPTLGPYLPASTAGWVEVYDDPHITYTVECVTSIGQSLMGLPTDVNISALTSATGISGFHLQTATASDISGNFRIIGLAPSELAVTAAGSPNNRVEVAVVLHAYNRQ